MGRKRRDCPICDAKNLVRLANHLDSVHHLSGEEKTKYLKATSSSTEESLTGNQSTPSSEPLSMEDMTKMLPEWDMSRILFNEGIYFT